VLRLERFLIDSREKCFDNCAAMYFRVKKQKNRDGEQREYLCVVESYREKKKVRQKTIANLGRLDELHRSGNLERLAGKLNELVGNWEIVNLARDVKAEWAKDYGMIEVLKAMWKKLEISKILLKEAESSEKEFAFDEAIQAMVINRLVKPGSKLETWRWKSEVRESGWQDLNVQHFYRAMDYLIQKKDEIEQSLFERTKDLFGQKLDSVLFDTTTFKYWGEHSASELLKYGHSKEKRMDLKQIIVGVLMSKEGLPLGHEVWEGNQSDMKSLKVIVSRLRDRYNIKKIVIVCDRGMVSEKNLKGMEEAGYEYIVGVKMRQLEERKKRELLNEWDFEVIREDLQVKEKKLEGRRYLVCFNPVEAKSEAKNREYFKSMLEQKVQDSTFKDWVIKNGYKKYVHIEGRDWQIKMDYKRLEEEKIYDGKWILLTNAEYSSKECTLYYKSLSQVEQGFRDLKSEIETGPIHHWVTRRIRAHVFICFLALLLKAAFEKALEKIDPKAVYSEVMRALEAVKATKLRVKDREIILRTTLPELAHLGFRAAGIRIPGDVLYLSPQTTPTVGKNVVPTSV
jgi:transposase